MRTRVIDGRTLEIDHLDKVFDPATGISKGRVIDYYGSLAWTMRPHLADRPLAFQRFPDGVGEAGFFQQHRPDHFPPWIRDVALARWGGSGGSVRHVVADDAPTLVFLAGQAVVTLHGWLARADAPDQPDRLAFDLDPPGDAFDAVRFAARCVRELLTAVDLDPHLMTTGSRGLHVVAPLDRAASFDEVRGLARALARRLAADHPEQLTVAQRKDQRGDRLYLDVLRNAYGQTTVLPYSLRARPGLPVATPLTWDELDRPELGPRTYHLANVRQRLAQKEDPWRTIDERPGSARQARERLERL